MRSGTAIAADVYFNRDYLGIAQEVEAVDYPTKRIRLKILGNRYSRKKGIEEVSWLGTLDQISFQTNKNEEAGTEYPMLKIKGW